MTDGRPLTVVCVADDSRSTERVDLVENTFVAFVMAENVSEAMAAGDRTVGVRRARVHHTIPRRPVAVACPAGLDGLHGTRMI